MLLPKFTISQDSKFVICNIHAPYTKVSDVDIHIDEFDFSFYAKPYLLKLKLPGKIVDEGSSCKYEADNGDYVVSILKENKGEEFVGLDLLTSLLHPQDKQCKVPKIEVLPEDGDKNTEADDASKVTEDVPLKALTNKYGYGFANQKSDVFPKSMTCEASVLFVSHPDQLALLDRTTKMEEAEITKFSAADYIGNMYTKEEYQFMFDLKPWWMKKDLSKHIQFDDDERETFMSLNNRDYLLTDDEKQSVLTGLVSVLFAYAYDVRVTDGDGCVESSWNIQILSPQLSWCCDTTDIKSTARACYRRLLCYPLYRSFELCELMWRDVAKILSLGVRFTLRCLLKVRDVFESADQAPYYLLNRLYIDDYCIWLQKHQNINDEQLMELSKQVGSTNLNKSDLDFNLTVVESVAEDLMTEDDESTEEEDDDDTSTTSSGSTEEDDTTSSSEEEDDVKPVIYKSETIQSNTNQLKLRLSRQSNQVPTTSTASSPPVAAAGVSVKLIESLSSTSTSTYEEEETPAKSTSIFDSLIQEISDVQLNDKNDDK